MTIASSQTATGLQALLHEYQTVSNNLANSSTSGFKRRVSTFSAELQRQQRMSEEHSLLKGQITANNLIDFSQGVLMNTGQPLDVALEGRGFIALETPQGPLYTRNGALSINLLSQLVDTSGRLVAGQNGPIVIPRNTADSDLHIDPDGTIRAGQMELGRIRIVEFGDATNELRPAGDGCFQAPEDAAPVPAANTRLRQGHREQSNVQTMKELSSLMMLSRLYETNINVLRKRSENTAAVIDIAKTT